MNLAKRKTVMIRRNPRSFRNVTPFTIFVGLALISMILFHMLFTSEIHHLLGSQLLQNIIFQFKEVTLNQTKHNILCWILFVCVHEIIYLFGS